ncbi:MAG TPA: hypothetical protein DGT23_31960 [Micromonosporaceae bacterium]|nr:hypothetical protein [Micromonosporaceae bacterium]
MSEPTVRVSQYTICGYPNPDSINTHLYEITVEERGLGRWAVCRMGRCCYDHNGIEEYEPNPSGRDDEWLERFRFADVDEAIEVAKRVVPSIIINGRTAAQCWAWEQNRAKELEVVTP